MHHHQENCRLIIHSSPSVESTWTEHDHSLFVNALVNTPEDVAGRWEKIADVVPGKTAEEVKAYHDGLEHELNEIEAGRVELPVYLDDYAVEVSEFKKGYGSAVSLDSSELGASQKISFGAGTKSNNSTRVEKGRKRGKPWSVDEHRRFLEGLKIYGKGDWRMISRNVVLTRTASQVASHAQKYFIRQQSDKKQKKRSSIHDITTADITTTDTAMVVHARSTPSTPPTPPTPPATIVYGTGQARGVNSKLPPQSISFYGGEGALRSSLITRPPPEINFYGGDGSTGTTDLPLTPMPISFCAGEGALLPPTNLYGEGQARALMTSPFMTDFYGGATPPPPPLLMGDDDDFLQNLLYHPFF